MRRLLLPLDGSDVANRAIPFATMLAKKTGQPLLLLRAVDPSTVTNPSDEAVLEQDAAFALITASQPLIAQGLAVETRVVTDPPDVAILDTATPDDVSLVVMSTHGRGGLDRWIHGSVADSILRESSVPVLVIPSQGLDRWEGGAPKVLVPLDGSDRARAALGPATEMATALGGSLVLASVVPYPQYVAYAEGYSFIEPDPGDVAIAEMRAYLEGLAATVRTPALSVEVIVEYGSAYGGITAMAEQAQATLIAMATHGRGGVSRAILGSVATATIRQAGVPVLLVRPGETQSVPTRMLDVAPSVVAEPPAQAAPAPEPVPAAPPPETVLGLTAGELDLLTWTLGARFHSEPVDPRWADEARVLLEKLRKARGGLTESGGRA